MSFERVCVRCGRACFSVDEWQNHECFDMSEKIDAEIRAAAADRPLERLGPDRVTEEDFDFTRRPHMYVLIGQTPVPEPDPMKWAFWMESADRVVFQDHIGSCFVSTVFLGLDHNHIGGLAGGRPILFETMIFADGGELHDYQERCSDWLEAEAQHAEAVKYALENCCARGTGWAKINPSS